MIRVGLVGHPLSGVREKIARAEAHLATACSEVEVHRNKCSILATKQPTGNSIYDLYATFPEPSLHLSCVVSDCLNNLRTALDYIVYELASKNGEPAIYNMFPICNNATAYDRQVERDRLHDVPESARAVVESLQPYKPGSLKHKHPLYMINRLLNTDKHRLLPLIAACRPKPTFFVSGSNGEPTIKATGITQTVYDGVSVPNQRLMEIQADAVTMQIKQGFYIGFKDVPWSESSIQSVIRSIIEFIRERVLPEFEPFFDERPESLVSSAGR